jgi:biopolymer transport protein ExbD
VPLKLSQDEPPTINLTSMIDILFLLLIFFMVATRFNESESNIQINLPKVSPTGAMMQSPSSKTVYLRADGSIQLDGQRVTPDQLTNMLTQAVQNYPETTVQIKPDAAVTMQQAADAMTAVRRSGAKSDGLAFASMSMSGVRR